MILHALLLLAPTSPVTPDTLFCIGHPDGYAREFALTDAGYGAFLDRFGDGVQFDVDRDGPEDWPFVHPAHRDDWAGGRAHTFSLHFTAEELQQEALYLLLGLAGAHTAERSRITVAVNGQDLPAQVAPGGDMGIVFNPSQRGRPDTIVFPVPAETIEAGRNTISIRLDEQSWIVYDYVALSRRDEPLELVEPPRPDLRAAAAEASPAIVFAVRHPGRDEHWYANFSYYAADDKQVTYGEGARLCRLDLASGELQVLLDDATGGIRDPKVHYDGRKVLFSYRPGGTTHDHLWGIGVDGEGLKQLTSGDYDDIEPTYLPDGGIAFVSSRCKRWVNCWLTQVATLHRCDAEGGRIRPLSSNNEHDNTPWVLPDGRLLYQRWEYVDRSQVHYHHLWTCNPDGTGQMVFYGNQVPGVVMIDAKPVPGTDQILATFSPGHGRTEHDGALVLLAPDAGPDDPDAVRRLHPAQNFRDPFALSPELFVAARGEEPMTTCEKSVP